MIPQGASSLPGMWDRNFAPYQSVILDALGDPESRKVVWRASSQVGKSLVLILFLLGIIKYMPAPTMVAMDTLKNAGVFYKNRVGDIIKANPELLDLVSSSVAKNARNKIGLDFPGGRVHLAGSTNASSLSSHPVKYAVGDEIGRWNRSASKEGDPVQLLDARLETYRGSELMYLCSTPTIVDNCKITEDFDLGTQEFWNLRCLDCEDYFKPIWELVTYDDDLSNVGIACPHCGSIHDDSARVRAAQRGKFIAENPEGQYRSFHTDSLSSPFANLKANIQKYIDSRGDLELDKVFTNTKLGLPFDEDSFGRESVSNIPFMEFSEDYNLTAIPANIAVITVATDTQDDRLETKIIGWASKTEPYYLDRKIHYGHTDNDAVWEEVSEYVNDFAVTREDKIVLKPSVWFCDAGGHRTRTVHKWAEINSSRPTMFAIKGSSKHDYPVVQDRPRACGPNKKGFHLMVGSTSCKFLWYSMLAGMSNKESVYRYHIPHNIENPENYFKQATSERIVTDKFGVKTFEKPHSSVRNEQCDLGAYNIAAIHHIDPDFAEVNRKLIENKNRMDAEPEIQEARKEDKKPVPKSTDDAQDKENRVREKHNLPIRRIKKKNWATTW